MLQVIWSIERWKTEKDCCKFQVAKEVGSLKLEVGRLKTIVGYKVQ